MRALRTKRVLCAVALSAAAFALGCGDDGDDVNNNADNYDGTEAEVAQTVDDLANAARDGDGSEVCEDIFAPQLAENVEREAQQTCATEVEAKLPEGEYELEIDSLEVDGDAATVGVTDQTDQASVLHIERLDSDWRVVRVTPAI
jgi:hypothetical protein